MYNAENTLTKGHQQRSCVVCREPVVDHQVESINIGGGLEVLVHRVCLVEITEALAPKAVTIPVPVSKPSVTRKSTMPIDEKRMADNIKAEVYAQLLKLGLSQ